MKALTFCTITFLLGCANGDAEHPAANAVASPWREVTDSVAQWLEAQAQPADGGLAWPKDVLSGDATGVDLADGSGGPVIFLLAHSVLAGDTSSARVARQGAHAIATRVAAELPVEEFPPSTSAWYGWASAAWVLERAGNVLADTMLTRAAHQIVRRVADRAKPTSDSTARWSEQFNDLLFGNAGTTLLMAWAAERFADSSYMEVAHRGALDLLARAQETPAGYGWTFRNDRPFVLPNFTHGAAGIAHTLLRVGQLTGDERLDSAAVRAARGLLSVADTTEGGFWLPYGWPNEEWIGRVDHGWAHGAAGTARLFMALDRAQPGQGWGAWINRAAHGLVSHANFLPGTAGDSLPNDLRFGRAGVAWFLADYGTHDSAAKQLTSALLALAARDSTGLYWQSPRPAFAERPGEPARYTGLFQGTSGYGLLMLRVGATPAAWDSLGLTWIMAPLQ